MTRPRPANGGSAPNKFDIGRAYLTFKGPLGDRVAYRVTTDIKQGGGTDSYKGWFVRLKYAYLQYDYMKPNADGASAFARLGVLHTVVVDHEENFWPRYLAQTGVEKNGFFSSADLGVSTQITLPNKLGEIYADVVNGTGYDNPGKQQVQGLPGAGHHHAAHEVDVDPEDADLLAMGLLRRQLERVPQQRDRPRSRIASTRHATASSSATRIAA